MEPALRDGDFLVVRRGSRVRPGAVVVGRFLDRPGLLVVKRAVEGAGDGGWLLVSDNTGAPGAARGPGRVEAVVLARYWPRPRLLLARRGR
jgi:SOS-response transcriptional repressor LexA